MIKHADLSCCQYNTMHNTHYWYQFIIVLYLNNVVIQQCVKQLHVTILKL